MNLEADVSHLQLSFFYQPNWIYKYMLGLNLNIWISEIYILFEEGERLLLFQTNRLKTLYEATGHEIRSMV